MNRATAVGPSYGDAETQLHFACFVGRAFHGDPFRFAENLADEDAIRIRGHNLEGSLLVDFLDDRLGEPLAEERAKRFRAKDRHVHRADIGRIERVAAGAIAGATDGGERDQKNREPQWPR